MKILLFFFCTGLLTASEAQLYFQQGNDALRRGNYRDALLFYRKAETGAESFKLFFNMGNCWFKIFQTQEQPRGALAYAVLYYRKAQLIKNDEDVRVNLAFAREHRLDAFEEHEPNILLKTFFFFYYNFNLHQLTLAALFFFAFSCIFLSLFFIGSGKTYRSIMFRIFVIGILCWSGTFLSALIRYRADYARLQGVLLSEKIELKNAPGDDYSAAYQIHEGAEFVIKEERGDWALVMMPGGQTGWLTKSNIAYVR